MELAGRNIGRFKVGWEKLGYMDYVEIHASGRREFVGFTLEVCMDISLGMYIFGLRLDV